MKNNSITIRIADINDVCDISLIEKECFTEPWSDNAVKDFIGFDGNVFLCAFDKDTLCGYISATFVLDELQISNVAVKNSFRRNGIASLLIERMLSMCQENKCSFLTLEVRTSNIPAIQLYKKYGFSVEGIRKNYYSNPIEHAYIMNRTI